MEFALPLDGDIQVGHVVQDELDHLLVSLFADMLDEAGGSELLAKLVRSQAILSEAVVEVVDDYGWQSASVNIRSSTGLVNATHRSRH